MDDITKPIVNKRKHCALIHCVQVGLERLRKAEKKRTFIVTNLCNQQNLQIFAEQNRHVINRKTQ